MLYIKSCVARMQINYLEFTRNHCKAWRIFPEVTFENFLVGILNSFLFIFSHPNYKSFLHLATEGMRPPM
jgi:hypothetical protein